MKTLILAICMIAIASVAQADTLVQHAQNQATANAMYHDAAAPSGENVYMHTGHLGPIRARLAARMTWASSEGHKRNLRRTLPLFGLAVSHSDNATYVTSRSGLFPRLRR